MIDRYRHRGEILPTLSSGVIDLGTAEGGAVGGEAPDHVDLPADLRRAYFLSRLPQGTEPRPGTFLSHSQQAQEPKPNPGFCHGLIVLPRAASREYPTRPTGPKHPPGATGVCGNRDRTCATLNVH